MNLLAVNLLALLSLALLWLLVYLPGWMIWRVFSGFGRGPEGPENQHDHRSDECQDDWLTIQYERIVVGVLINGWLALMLAGFGVFSLWLHGGILLVGCGVLLLRSGLPRMRPSPPPPRVTGGKIAFVLIGIIGLVLVLPPFETVLGVRDAGVYANAGFAIARSGGVVLHDPLLADLGMAAHADNATLREPARQALSNFLGVQHPERFIATRMRTAGFFINEGDMNEGRVIPQGFHLLPAWIGLLTSLGGFSWGLFAPGFMGLLGAWSVGMLGRRLGGEMVGVLAFLFLMLNSVQVWFSRYSTAETTAQFLTFAGLYFFARFQQIPTAGPRTPRLFAAAVAGVAMGQLVLTRIDFFLVVGPLVLYLLICLIAHRWTSGHTALSIGLGVMLVHAGLHTAFIARAYFFDTAYARLQDYAITAHLALPFLTPILREVYHTRTGSMLKDPMNLLRELGGGAVVVGVLVLLWRFPRPLHWLGKWGGRGRGLLFPAVAVGVVVLATYAYLIRPQIITMETLRALPSCLFSPHQWSHPGTACLRLQGYIGAPVAIPDPEQETRADDLRTHNPRRYYTAGLHALLSHMGRNHPAYDEAVREGQRLLDTSTLSPETPSETQADAFARLDAITEQVLSMPFDTLCRLNIPTPERDAKYVIPLANFVRVGWYLSPLGVVLAVVGLARWWWGGCHRASWLFLVIGVLGTFFYVRQTYGTSDQTYIYILRRFVAVSYPALTLGIAYALGRGYAMPSRGRGWARVLNVMRWGVVCVLTLFFLWTGRPIYQHTEYAGIIPQLEQLANRFGPEDVLLFRGGGPTYGQFRDIPDLITTPLSFAFGRNALTIKSKEPSKYGDMLAAQVRRWQEEGRTVYLLLSASGGDFTLPGFAWERVGDVVFTAAEFEQLTNQKPHNAAQMRLPFTIYQVQRAQQVQQTSALPRLDGTEFSAQVRGFYLPEPDETGSGHSYAWTNGDAVMRLPWPGSELPDEVEIWLGGGSRPPHLGPAQVCLSLMPDITDTASLSHSAAITATIPLPCITLDEQSEPYRVHIPADARVAYATSRVLLRLESPVWIPAEEDPRLHDRRGVGVQVGTANE